MSLEAEAHREAMDALRRLTRPLGPLERSVIDARIADAEEAFAAVEQAVEGQARLNLELMQEGDRA